MTKFSVKEYEAACCLLDLEYSKEYLNAPINGIRVIVDRKAGAISLDIPEEEYLITPEEADIERVIDALHTALKDKIKIEQKIEDELAKAKARLEPTEEEWKPWPGTTPPEDEECIVRFTENGHARTLIGRYHSEFDLWSFPSLDNRIGTITKSDPPYYAVIYKPLEE